MIKHIALRLAALLVATTALAPAIAQTDDSKPERYDCEASRALPQDADQTARRIACEIPEKYRFDVAMSEFIGRQIRLHDLAAWLTTDALVAAKAFENVQGQGRGWLTQAEEQGVQVRYFAERDGTVTAIASARLDLESFKAVDARKLSPPEPITEREQRLMRAKSLALAADGLTLCTDRPPNTVVIESDENGNREILVFAMSAWVDDAIPLGGYHMFRISEDGGTINSHFSQTRACPMANGPLEQASALAVTHMNSAAPTMFHVFMSLQYRKPIYVSTTQNGLQWRVQDGQISLLKDQAGTTK